MKTITLLVVAILAALAAAGVADGAARPTAAPGAADGDTRSTAAVPPASAPTLRVAPRCRPAWARIDDFAYQLQDVSLAKLGASRFDLVIMDYSRDGSDATRFTAAQVARLRASPGGPKRVLAYLSVGEAEDYRWYWSESWDADHDGEPDAGAPAWLGPSNPDWSGCYKVRYWDPAWQALVFGAPDSYVDKIVAAGFDGVYLDIVDAYEYWGSGGESGLGRAGADQEMVDFVRAIATYARVTKGRPGFAVFPQNGADLGSHAEYLQVVTGIGQEDTWYDGNARQPLAETISTVRALNRFRNAGKPVLCTDYCRRDAAIDRLYRKARGHGFVPYSTVRDLDRLVVNPGHAPD